MNFSSQQFFEPIRKLQPQPKVQKKITLRKSKIFHIYKEIWSYGHAFYCVEIINYDIIKHFFSKWKSVNILLGTIQGKCYYDIRSKANKNEIKFFFHYVEDKTVPSGFIERLIDGSNMSYKRGPRPDQIFRIMRYIKVNNNSNLLSIKKEQMKKLELRTGFRKDRFSRVAIDKPFDIKGNFELADKAEDLFYKMLRSPLGKDEVCLAQCYYIRDLIIEHFNIIGIKIQDSYEDQAIVNIIVKKKKNPPKFINPNLKSEKTKEEAFQCKICFENKINTIVLDCGHACMCSSCAKWVINKNNGCPICRKQIKLGIRDMYI